MNLVKQILSRHIKYVCEKLVIIIECDQNNMTAYGLPATLIIIQFEAGWEAEHISMLNGHRQPH